jgi:hypothetical protein
MLGKYNGMVWIGFIWLKTRTCGDSSEHGNKPVGSIKVGEVLDYMSDYELLRSHLH